MTNSIYVNVCVSDRDYAELKKKGNVSNYLKTQMFARMDKYGDLPTVGEILGGKRNKVVIVCLNPGMKNMLEKKGAEYGMTWNEYGKRVCAKVLADSRMESVSNRSETDALLEAMETYVKTLGDSELDNEILNALDGLTKLVNKKTMQNRYKRMIPEIQCLMEKGYSLDDIVNVAKVMNEGRSA